MNNNSDTSQTKAPSITFSVLLATLLILAVASLTTLKIVKAPGGTYTKKSREPSNKNDASRQGEFLLQKAFASGFDSVESWMLSGSMGIKEFTAAATEWRAGERFSAPADPEADAISNPALRERLNASRKKDIMIRSDALAPAVTGRVENAAAAHKEIRSITFNLFKRMKKSGYEGDFDEFYQDFTDTPLPPKEADAYIKNFNLELKERLEKYQFGRVCRGRSSGGRDLQETELRQSRG